MKITLQLLRENDACKEHLDLFEETFGESADFTKRNWNKANKAGLDLGWMECLLDGEFCDDYDAKMKPIKDDYHAKVKPIKDDYYAKLKPINDDYDAKRESIRDDYDAKMKLIRDDYDAKVKLIIDDYHAKMKPINDDYRAKMKPILFDALTKQFRAEAKI